jgi:hypothetical protein
MARETSMPLAELVWIFGLLGLLVAVNQVFLRLRRRASDFWQMREVKQRLPPSVRGVEKLVLYALALLPGVAVFKAFASIHKGEIAGASLVYAVVGSVLVSLPLACFGVNGFIWAVPQLRRANQTAMSGTQVSLASAKRGLLFFAAASIPAGLIILALAVIAPWGRP